MPTQRLIPRVLLITCALLMVATATLLTRVIGQRAELDAQAARIMLAEQECRGLRQQLEAEQLLAIAQTRLLREALAAPASTPSTGAPSGDTSTSRP